MHVRGGGRSSIASTTSRISEHRSLLEENRKDIADCLLQRWTSADHASSRPTVWKPPIYNGDWALEEVDLFSEEEPTPETTTTEKPVAPQAPAQPEERYRAQVEQMLSSRDWIIESYSARLDHLVNGTYLYDHDAFRSLASLFHQMLVDLYWDIGKVRSNTISSAGRERPPSSYDSDETLHEDRQTTTASSFGAPAVKCSLHRFSFPSLPSPARRLRRVNEAFKKSFSLGPFFTTSSLQGNAVTSGSLTLNGSSPVPKTPSVGGFAADNPSNYAGSVAILDNNSTKSCPHPVTTLVDRLARSRLEISTEPGSPAHAQLPQELYEKTRGSISTMLGEAVLSKQTPLPLYENRNGSTTQNKV